MKTPMALRRSRDKHRQQAAQVADVGAADLAGLDLHDDALRAFVLVQKVDEAVHAAVGALAAFSLPLP